MIILNIKDIYVIQKVATHIDIYLHLTSIKSKNIASAVFETRTHS